MLMLILLVTHAVAAGLEGRLRGQSGDAETAREMAGRAAALALALLGSLPLWLGPAAELLAGRHPWIIDAVVGMSPLTHLAVASGNDLLRNQWFYQHSNLAALQFSYPSLAGTHPVLRLGLLGARARPAGIPASASSNRWRRPDLSHDGAKQMMKRLLLALLVSLAGLVLATPAVRAADGMDPALREKAQRAIDGGLHYLRGQQAPDGSVLKSVGITALSLRAFLESHRGYTESDGAFITRQVDFLLSKVKSDGSISESLQNTSLQHRRRVDRARRDEEPEVRRGHRGRAKVPDPASDRRGRRLQAGPSAITAGSATAETSGPTCPTCTSRWRASRPRRPTPRIPSGRRRWCSSTAPRTAARATIRSGPPTMAASPTGPARTRPSTRTGPASYGGMTAAGLLSLLFAGTDKNDPRVQAAYKWMTANYTLEVNPGTTKKHGLFYFYNAFAKVMAAYGEDTFTDGKGQKHNWRNELVQKLRQPAGGGWVLVQS